jgi:hypothetical protein
MVLLGYGGLLDGCCLLEGRLVLIPLGVEGWLSSWRGGMSKGGYSFKGRWICTWKGSDVIHGFGELPLLLGSCRLNSILGRRTNSPRISFVCLSPLDRGSPFGGIHVGSSVMNSWFLFELWLGAIGVNLSVLVVVLSRGDDKVTCLICLVFCFEWKGGSGGFAGGWTLLDPNLWSQLVGFLLQAWARKLRYLFFFSSGTALALTWLSLLLQSKKQSPLVCHLTYIQQLFLFNLGLSFALLPLKSWRQSSPSFNLKASVMFSCLMNFLAALLTPLFPLHFLPFFLTLSCLPEGVAPSSSTAGLVVSTVKIGGRSIVRLLLRMCSMTGSMSMILSLMADLSTSCLHSLSQHWMRILIA